MEVTRNSSVQIPWWSKIRTYIVQIQEGNQWVNKMSSDTEWPDDFRIIARNPFARILKDGEDITSKYKEDSECITSSVSTEPQFKPPCNKIAINNNKPKNVMKPSEYKNMIIEDKQILWNRIEKLLSTKAKRSQIFEDLNISEATYDAIRADMKSDKANCDTNCNKADTVIVDTSTEIKIHRPGLLRRR